MAWGWIPVVCVVKGIDKTWKKGHRLFDSDKGMRLVYIAIPYYEANNKMTL